MYRNMTDFTAAFSCQSRSSTGGFGKVGFILTLWPGINFLPKMQVGPTSKVYFWPFTPFYANTGTMEVNGNFFSPDKPEVERKVSSISNTWHKFYQFSQLFEQEVPSWSTVCTRYVQHCMYLMWKNSQKICPGFIIHVWEVLELKTHPWVCPFGGTLQPEGTGVLF